MIPFSPVTIDTLGAPPHLLWNIDGQFTTATVDVSSIHIHG